MHCFIATDMRDVQYVKDHATPVKNRPEDDCSIVETCSLCNYLV